MVLGFRPPKRPRNLDGRLILKIEKFLPNDLICLSSLTQSLSLSLCSFCKEDRFVYSCNNFRRFVTVLTAASSSIAVEFDGFAIVVVVVVVHYPNPRVRALARNVARRHSF